MIQFDLDINYIFVHALKIGLFSVLTSFCSLVLAGLAADVFVGPRI